MLTDDREANSELAMQTDLNDLERDKETTFGMEMQFETIAQQHAETSRCQDSEHLNLNTEVLITGVRVDNQSVN